MSPKIINCYVHPHRDLVLVRDFNTSAYGQGAVEPVQNLWASSTFLGIKTTHRWRPILGLSKPLGDHQDHLQQWE